MTPLWPAHRCADCLDELPRDAPRFVVFVADASSPYGGREHIVCAACVGWYPNDTMAEVSAAEVGL